MPRRLNRATVSPLLLSLVFSLAAAACGGGTTVTELGGPNPVRCLTSFATPSPTVPAEGGSLKVTVSAARECTWSASGSSSWLQVSPTSGQGESPITVTASVNPDANPRAADVVVNDQRLSIRQEPAPCVYELSSRTANLAAAGGRVSVGVSVASGCGWTAASPQPWVRVLNPSGSGSTNVELAVDANAGPTRTAQLTIAGVSFTVTQAAFSETPAPPPAPAPAPTPPEGPAPVPPAACSYSLDPTFRSVSRKARSGDIDVRTSSGCAWTAESTVSWISIRSGSSGTGNGKVDYRVDENDGLVGRQGTIRVAGQTFTLYQEGILSGDD